MSRFQRKPTVIEAHQWFKNGDHPQDYASDVFDINSQGEMYAISGEERKEKGWEGSVVRYYRHPNDHGERRCDKCGVRMHEHGWIDNPLYGYTVCPGDWIIQGESGEFYPCKPDAFDRVYSPLGDDAA